MLVYSPVDSGNYLRHNPLEPQEVNGVFIAIKYPVTPFRQTGDIIKPRTQFPAHFRAYPLAWHEGGHESLEHCPR
jgi:hypothetical protein